MHTIPDTFEFCYEKICRRWARRKGGLLYSKIIVSMSRALILIDYINEFLHPEGKITPQGMGEFCREHHTIENVQKLIRYFREQGEEIIWIHLGFHENYDNCSRISPRFSGAPSAGILREDTWSTEFLTELDHREDEMTFTKIRVSPFYQTGLEEYLGKQGIDTIVVA